MLFLNQHLLNFKIENISEYKKNIFSIVKIPIEKNRMY